MKPIKALRLLCTLTALCLLITALTGCQVRPIKSAPEDLVVVGQVDGYDVYYEELRYLTLKFRQAMADTYGEDIWTAPEKTALYRDELYTNVYQALTTNYAVLSLCREVLIDTEAPEISDAVQKDVNTMAQQMGGKKAYRQGLAEEYLTDHFYRFTLGIGYLESELLYVYTDDLGLIADTDSEIYDIIMSDEFARTLHIYLENSPETPAAENRVKAEKILEEYRSGVGFNTLIGRYSQDYYMTTTNGYYFMRGEMQKTYEDAAFALAENEVSPIVETDDGVYIIERLPKDPQYVMSHLTELISQYQYAALYNIIDAHQDTLSFVPNDYALSLDLITLP